jgi:GTP-binding protein Era
VAIVSDKPQTTRRRILGIARRPGVEMALVDTPGIHKPEYRMNAAMVRDATDALRAADVVLVVVDASEKRGGGDAYIAELVASSGSPAILALNKIDRIAKPKLLPLMAEYGAAGIYREIVPISALRGEGVEDLARVLEAQLPEGEPGYPEDFLTATPETEWVAEVIREKLLERTREELPFASAILIESFREAEGKDLTVVTASVIVEREGQKGIVVGKGGSMIRDIGTAARQELEAQTGRRFYLELTVRVRPDWRNDERFLSALVADPSAGKG